MIRPRSLTLALVVLGGLLVIVVSRQLGRVESAGRVALPAELHQEKGLASVEPAPSISPSSERLSDGSRTELLASEEPGEPTGDRELRLHVLDAGRRPLEGCLVALVDNGDNGGGSGRRSASSAVTDADGIARYRGLFGRGVVYVRHPEPSSLAFPWREELDLAAGDNLVQLPAAQEIRGIVRVDGAPPARTLEITLHQEPPGQTALEGPGRVAALLNQKPDDLFRIRRETAPDGAFRFEGIPAGWSGRLVFHGAYALAAGEELGAGGDGHNELLLSGPQTGLAIELKRLLCIQGRIVSSDGTQGVPHAAIMALVTTPKLDMPDQGISADAQGRFEVPIESTDFLRVRLEFGDAQGRGRQHLDFAREDVPRDLDLGDLPLADRRSVEFRAMSVSGEPIEGAFALSPDGIARAQPTDLDGRGALDDLPEDASSFTVVAAGFRMRTVPLSGALPDAHPPPEVVPQAVPEVVLDVVLEPASALSVCVRSEDALALEDLRLRLSSEQPLFVEADPWTPQPAELALHGSIFYSSSSGPQGGSALFGLNAEGCLSLQGLAAGTPIGLRIEDRLGAGGCERVLAPLAEGEHRKLEIDLQQATQLLVRVVDEGGDPVSQARVTIRGGGDRGMELKTDSEGKAFARGLFATDVTLSVLANGFAPLVWSGPVPDPAHPNGEPAAIELVALRGCNVLIRVRDEAGTPLEGGSLEVRSRSSPVPIATEEVGIGMHALRDLPKEPLDVELQIGGGRYQRAHDPKVPELVFELPLHGRVFALWKLRAWPEPDPPVIRVVLRPLDPGRTELGESYSGEILHGRHDFDPVLPGKYTLHLEATSPEGKPLDLVEPVTVTVHEAQTTEIELTGSR